MDDNGKPRERSLNFATLRKANVTRLEKTWHKLNDWTETDWLTAVAGELGELAGLIKKKRRGDKVAQIDVSREIADITIYLDLLAAKMGVDLGNAVIEKFNLTSALSQSDIKLRAK